MGEDRRNSAPTAALATVAATALAAVAAVAVATGYIASTAASQATTFASSAVATTVAVAVVLFILDSCHTCVSKSPTVANPRARPVASTDAAMSSPQLPPHHRYPPHHYHYHPPHHTTCRHHPLPTQPIQAGSMKQWPPGDCHKFHTYAVWYPTPTMCTAGCKQAIMIE